MMTPILISVAVVLAIIALCFFRPNAGRIFLGCFFLVMAFAVNGFFILANPQGYVDYLSGSMLPLYRDLTAVTVALNPTPYGVLLALFEIAMGVLLLSKSPWVKFGLIGTMGFVILLAPVSLIQIPWLGLLIGQAYLLTKTFDRSLPEMIFKRNAA